MTARFSDKIDSNIDFEKNWRKLSTFMMALSLQAKGFEFNWDDIRNAIPGAEPTIQMLQVLAADLQNLPEVHGKRVLPLQDAIFQESVAALADSDNIRRIQGMIAQQVTVFLTSLSTGTKSEA